METIVEQWLDPNTPQSTRDVLKKPILDKNGENQALSENTASLVEQIIDLINSDGSLDNFTSQLGLIINKYKDFLSFLTVEQHSPLINLLGLIIILSCLISIGTIFYSDYLIKYLAIESKFPRIAKFIALRRKFQWYYFNLALLLMLVIIAILIWFNLDFWFYLQNK